MEGKKKEEEEEKRKVTSRSTEELELVLKKQKNLKLMLTIKKCFRVPPPNKTRIRVLPKKP